MVSVIVKEDQPFEKVLKRFRREVERTSILKETKGRVHYEKPSASAVWFLVRNNIFAHIVGLNSVIRRRR